MKDKFHRILILGIVFLSSCAGSATTPTTTPATDLDTAGHTLRAFFNALSRDDYKEAASYHLTPNPLSFLYDDIDPDDGEALLAKACTPNEESWCVFYCWKISEVTDRWQISSDEFIFEVRFVDAAGHLLTTGDNITPQACGPSGCDREEFTYHVKKIDGDFFVDGIPVFSGCWP